METLDNVIFYTIDKAIRTYRQFAQKQIKEAGYNITIDQWLIIKTIMDYPQISQLEIAERVFKDSASVTRIIELLVLAEFLHRESNSNDRRKTKLTVTPQGLIVIADVQKIVLQNRATALQGISVAEMQQVESSLSKIIANCAPTV